MNRLTIVNIEEVLEQANVFSGWLYLPPRPWTLKTEGIFIEENLDADPSAPYPPAILAPCALQDALDAAGIEGIIYNARDQLGKPTLEQLFDAFLFYLENDAYIEFDTP